MTTKCDQILASRLANLKASRPKTKYEKEIIQQRLWNRKKALENLYAQAPRLDETTQQMTLGGRGQTQSETEEPKKRETKPSEVPKWILERKKTERRSEKK